MNPILSNLRKAARVFCSVWSCVLLGGTGAGWAQSNLVVAPLDSYAGAGFARGPFHPAWMAYTLSNAGPDTLAWSSVKSASWYSLSDPSGVLAPGETRQVLLFPNSRAIELPADSYRGSLLWIDQTHAESRETFVNLEVSVPEPALVEDLEVAVRDALELSFTGVPGTSYALEATPDFLTWTMRATNMFAASSDSYRADTEAFENHFYRVISFGDEAIPARLSLAQVTVLDPLRYRIHGDAGGTYLLETSTNGNDWSAVLTNQVPAEGSFVFTNLSAGIGEGLMVRGTGLDVFPTPDAHHVLVTGQSLAVGIAGAPALSTDPSPLHFRFASLGTNAFINPLRELGAETILSAAANHVSRTLPEHRMVMSNAGAGSAGYEQLKKGTELYAQGVRQFRDAAMSVSAQLLGYQPSAIFVVHGEADHLDENYDLSVREWQSDYEADIRNVTGQNVPIPMFHSQVSSWTRFGGENGRATTVGTYELLRESIAHPDQTVLVCPKYMFPYADGIHLTNFSYRWLGEYYGKVYRKVVVEQQVWSPLRPLSVVRTNNIITARFHVPVPPLVIDTNLVSNPGRFGFEYWDDSGSPASLFALRVVGDDTVELGIARLPAGNVEERLRYAYTGTPGNWGGPATGPRGNLRDSDPEPSAYGNTLYNWCVHFDEPIVAAP